MVHHRRGDALRNALVAALSSCADGSLRREARRFLAGLSSDELEFIAEFLGACILDAACILECRQSRAELAVRIAEFQHARVTSVRLQPEDREHKTILLLEYLCRSGLREFPAIV
jgi:hypothetical protein